MDRRERAEKYKEKLNGKFSVGHLVFIKSGSRQHAWEVIKVSGKVITIQYEGGNTKEVYEDELVHA